MNWRDFFMGCGFMLAIIGAACGLAWLMHLNPPLVFGLLMLALVIGCGLMSAKFGPPWA